MNMVRLTLPIMLIGLTITMTACESRLFTIHKIDVQQGNAIDSKQVAQLKVGMDKNQVKFLMGSPLITDIFHPDRWDYVYHLIPDYGPTERYHLSVFFAGDKVVEIRKNDLPEPAHTSEDEATNDVK